ncbi:MAG: glycosyltransferase family 39 protein, partial [Anaerolineae bacterium]
MAIAKTIDAKWWLIAVLLLAFGARVYRIDHQSFWNDEGNSASLSSRSVSLIIEGTASDVHPPLYYLVLRAWWPLAGQTDFSLRMISAVAGLIQVAATIAIGRLWLSRKGAIAAGLLLALSPPLIYYSQEARMYALLGAIATCSMLVLFRGLKKENSQSKLAYSAVFAFLTVLGLYTHYVYPAVIAAQGLIVFMSFEGLQRKPSLELVNSIFNQFWHWLAAVVVALLAYAPWLPIFLRTGSSTRAAGDALPADFLHETAYWLAMGPFAELNPLWLMGVIFTGVYFAGGVIALLSVQFRQRIIVALIWLTIPIMLMLAVGATDENYRKFLTVVVPAVYLVIILGGEWLDKVTPLVKGSNVVWSVVFIMPILMFGVWDLYTDPQT